MRDAVMLLKNDYNIDVIGSLYLVDRSRDRIPLHEDRLGLTHPAVQVTNSTKRLSYCA